MNNVYCPSRSEEHKLAISNREGNNRYSIIRDRMASFELNHHEHTIPSGIGNGLSKESCRQKTDG